MGPAPGMKVRIIGCGTHEDDARGLKHYFPLGSIVTVVEEPSGDAPYRSVFCSGLVQPDDDGTPRVAGQFVCLQHLEVVDSDEEHS